MSHLIEHYRKEVNPSIKKDFGIDNVMAVPKIDKVVINVGIGKFMKDDKYKEHVVRDLSILSGQKPVMRKARKSIAGFKVRQGMDNGIMVTIRGKRMYDFIDRFINIALPRSKDFRGIDLKNFDARGNLNIGVKEHSIFPEINYESLKDIFGLQITVVTTAKTREQGIALLKQMGFPLKNK